MNDKMEIRALSVHGVWVWPMFNGSPIKDIENRNWYTSYRGWLAIHATAKTITKPGYQEFLAYYGRVGGNIAAVPAREQLVKGSVVGLVRLAHIVRRHSSPWFEGKYGWVLESPIALPAPIGVTGNQGLWTLPDDVRAEIVSQIGRQLKAADIIRQAA